MRGMVSASHLRARSANAATDSVARADAVSVMTAACVNAYDVSGESYWPKTVMTLPLGRNVRRGDASVHTSRCVYPAAAPPSAVEVTTTVTVLASAFDAMTSSGASAAETTCPPVTLTS